MTSTGKWVKLGDLITIIHGRNQSGVEDYSGCYPIVGSGGEIGRATEFLCPGETVVVGRKGTINTPQYWATPFWNVDTAFGLVCNKERIMPRYLYHFCIYFDFLSLNAGATLPSLTKKKISDIEIPLPSIDEQDSIFYLLDNCLDHIENINTFISTLDTLIKARFVEMFGDPKTNSQGRAELPFIDVVKMQRGFDLPVHSRNADGSVPVYGSNGILGYHDEAKVLQPGIITGRSGTIGKVEVSAGEYWPLNTTLFSVETHNNNVVFLKYLVELFELVRFVQGAGVPTLNRNNFHQELIFDIPKAEQQQFATFVAKVEEAKGIAGEMVEKLQMLYDSLAQEYFAR